MSNKKLSPISLLYFGIALILPLVLFLELGQNSNERHPWMPFVLCPVLMLGAGLLTVPGEKKWLALCVFIGIMEAVGLTLGV